MTKLEAARLTDDHTCPSTVPHPHVGGPVLGPGAARVFIRGRNAALLADYVSCAGAAPGPVRDVVKRGASSVRAHGLPLARRTDTSVHGGLIESGADNVFVGGPSFELPANFELDGPADYQNRVIRDVYLLSTIPKGRELLRRLEASGRRVRLVCADGKKTDSQRETLPSEDEDGVLIVEYDSTTQEYTYGDEKQEIPVPPQTRLAHELIHALHDAEGTARPPHEQDPTPDEAYRETPDHPWSQPPMEESVTTGTGAGESEDLSENAIRRELGLPPRDRYGSPTHPQFKGKATDIRPGDP